MSTTIPARPPLLATYRLQFNKDFTFQDAARIVDYLADLGITHVYASPILTARRGSSHGYDVTDPTRLNPDLGMEADFLAFREKLRERGMGLILDIVPNHMSASSENAWWMDVLENGPESAYASYFDIDWRPPSRILEGKVLLPVLGRPFGEALEHQELKLIVLEGKFFVQYFESLFPLAPATYHLILRRRLNELRDALGEESPSFQEYSGIAAAAAALTDDTTVARDAGADRRQRFESLRQRLRQLMAQDSKISDFIAQNLTGIDGQPKDRSSFSSLETILAHQHYLLAYWQNVNEEINYRRFFTINDLVGQRMQDPLVFDATHALIFRMIEQGSLDGLRIDHIDGLRDPLGYLKQLTERVATATTPALSASVSESAAANGGHLKLWIFVEKILGRGEHLPSNWPVAGTTGYDFVNALNAFFVDPKGAGQIEKAYSRFIGKQIAYDDLLYQKKKIVMSILLGVEIRAAGQQFQMLARNDRYAREIPRLELNQVLLEATAQLSVYRTYIRNLDVTEVDKRYIEQAIQRARIKAAQLSSQAFEFLEDVLLLRNRPHLLPGQREARLAFVMRWQQFTGPIMAKAFEDTFLYVFNPLISLNEVGGDPRPSTAHAADFPRYIKTRQKEWPYAMNASTTHDTKRGEDVRARVNVLSEIPAVWKKHLERWSKVNEQYRKTIDGEPVPDRNEEIFLYETLLGTWRFDGDRASFISRLKEYAIKATREAMVHTRWTRPNLRHEQALERFIGAILKANPKNEFLADFTEVQERVAFYGMANGLAQTLLKIASPGVPDFYQGSDLWDFRMVDPDNRSLVDFEERKLALTKLRALDESPSPAYIEVAKNWRDGSIKLYVIWKALQQRSQHPELYSDGEFITVDVRGKRAEHVTAFARRLHKDWAVVVVPRWLARAGFPLPPHGVGQFWGDTALQLPKAAPTQWKNVFTNGKVVVARKNGGRAIRLDELGQFPVALLTTERSHRKV